MKRIIKLFVILSTAIVMSASSEICSFAINTEQSKDFGDSTVITAENIYDVCEFLGIDSSDIEYSSDNDNNNQVTVGQLKNYISQAKAESCLIKMKSFNQNNYYSSSIYYAVKSSSTSAKAQTGTKTVYNDSSVGDCPVTYSVTGQYYKKGSTKYWTSVTDNDISLGSPSISLYFYDIKSISKSDSYVKNAKKSNSQIVFSYKYDLGTYLGISYFSVCINTCTVSGTTYFSGSSYI